MIEPVKAQLKILNQQVKELASIYHSVATRSGTSSNEFWVWYALIVMGGEYSQQDISDTWSLPKQTVNSIISNLSKKEYVYLEAVPGTRNRKIIRLTQAGMEYGKAVVAPIYQAEQQSLDHMSEDELNMCVSLLGKYIRLLKGELDEA